MDGKHSLIHMKPQYADGGGTQIPINEAYTGELTEQNSSHFAMDQGLELGDAAKPSRDDLQEDLSVARNLLACLRIDTFAIVRLTAGAFGTLNSELQ